MPLPKLKDITWVTADCYGTLIDWEKGILDAFRAQAQRDGFSFDEQPFIRRFLEVQAEIMAGSYELYAEVLRRTAVKVGGKKGWVHIGSGYDADIAPLLKMNVPVIWVNRHGEKLEGRKKPDAEVKTF